MSVTIALIGSNPEREEIIKQSVRERIEFVSEPDLKDAVTTTLRTASRIAIVDLGLHEEAGLRALEDLRQGATHAQVVALASGKDPDLILRAIRAGAREFVALDNTNEIGTILMEMIRRVSADIQTGAILSFFASKGGVGSTTLATNVLGMLATAGKRVLLVDLDLQLGDALVFLDTASRYSLADVLQNLKRLDRDLLLQSLTRHKSGAYVLSQSDRLKEADKVDLSRIGEMLRFLAKHFDYVICDGLRGFNEMSLAALDVTTTILLVITQDIPSVKNGRRCLDIFGKLGYEGDKTYLVCNRYDKNEIDLQTISYNLGVGVASTITNDYATVVKAVNRGLLLTEAAPRARVTEDIRRLANQVTGGEPSSERGGFLAGLFRGKGKAESGRTGKGVAAQAGISNKTEG